MQAAFATSQRVFPTEYAYHRNSVTRSEMDSANCMNYPSTLGGMSGVHSEHYIYCYGTQLLPLSMMASYHVWYFQVSDSVFFAELSDGFFTWRSSIAQLHCVRLLLLGGA